MNLTKGLVSVIMANYNTPEVYLRHAIESILGQTYSNLEFIIVDDGSTDNSLEIIKSYNDSRIKILKNEENLGITKSLNIGLNFAKGEYIARMDADDICYKDRFKKQVEFLRSNRKCIVCGTWIEQIDESGINHMKKTQCRVIPKQELYSIYLLFGNYPNIAHPSSMFRHDLLVKNNIKYDEEYPFAQDYRMWVECNKVGECANVPEILLKYRVHTKAVSQEKKELQRYYALKNIKEQLAKLEVELPTDYEDIHMGLLYGRHKFDLKYKKWIKVLIDKNKDKKVYNHSLFKQLLWEKWTEILYYSLRDSKGIVKKMKIFFQLDVKNIKYFIKKISK